MPASSFCCRSSFRATAFAIFALLATSCASESDPPVGGADGVCETSEVCDRGFACSEAGRCEVIGDCTTCLADVEACLKLGADGTFDPDASGVCTASECARDRECGADQVCVEGACYAQDDSCETRDECPGGQVCIAGECSDPTGVCSSDEECPAGEACGEDGSCAPETGETCGGETCAAGETCIDDVCTVAPSCDPPCGDGQTCNAETGVCEDDDASTLCSPCTSNMDCGGDGDNCIVLAGVEPFCGSACASNDDCPDGFTCGEVDARGTMQCVPTGGSCSGCAAGGCGDGQFCNTSSGECESLRGSCETCGSDSQCGDGASCAPIGERTFCLDACGDGCADGFTCQTVEGEELCAPDSGSCASCDEPPTCGGGTPILDELNCRCVGCLGDDDCNDGEVCTRSGACLVSGGECTESADCFPGYCQGATAEESGICVECLTAGDCSEAGAGAICIRGACQVCDYCEEGERCDPSGACVEIPGTGGDCESDADCVAASIELGGTGENAKCDPAIGCYTAGACSGGGGGGGLPIPGLPTGSGDPFGAPCPAGTTCQPILDLTGSELIGQACTGCTVGDPATCRDGETCTEPLLPLSGPYCAAGGGGGGGGGGTPCIFPGFPPGCTP